VRAASNGVTSIGVAKVAKLAHGSDISWVDFSSGRVTSVGGTLCVSRDGVGNVLAARYIITTIGEALVAKLAHARNISLYNVSSGRVTSVGGTLCVCRDRV
jgi:uncharacterized protein YjhX (UPF0386 family)